MNPTFLTAILPLVMKKTTLRVQNRIVTSLGWSQVEHYSYKLAATTKGTLHY